ncbi:MULTISPECIES: hypothetical protein [Limnospira]|uniref:Uncharacterized protein n=1 Tax=Limnospira fusiformis PMC 851.14 TaxID=2219512 RepID=A0ABU9ELG8_LIMFS|nr:hypothetical protein [Limnospira maxima]EKD06240.1 hypothetical protein SPLC1_S541850 [Arthrospira platensis C1]QJB24357.1 hypothetical protein HFV01_03725 [Limnospira fusiformis SAG 85.79]EKD06746.1 hypothetical protein SPLC1_S533400 [Arthrospira platensis C1]QJB24368.1 hypothetical protein HFV01_05605 [Limnospira fusiformis SAG 85.79]QJB24396.1 hypothetical protein HFV01_12030 [Limnospira fusiformis SAG 85.79]
MDAAYQPISLLTSYGGSSQTFGFPNHGWLAVVASGSRFYFTPSVPRFNPRFVISETGGGYRLYSFPNHPKWVEILLLVVYLEDKSVFCDFLNGIDPEFPALLRFTTP